MERFYNNLQERGDCQTTRKPYKKSQSVRWVVGLALQRWFDRAIEEGELPRSVSAADLAGFYYVITQGLALQVQHSGTREQLLRVADVALQGWPKPST